MARYLQMDDDLYDYVVDHSNLPDPTLPALTERTAAETGDRAGMQIGPDEGAMLTALTRMVRAELAVEVGTFTGYSSICIARGLAPGGRLLCCDVSEEWTAIGREAWAEAGVDDRIDLRIGPAAETLAEDPFDGEPLDMAFVDADKPGYVTYHDLLVPRLRPGGVLAVDNTLWSGRVVDDDPGDEARTAIRAYNAHAAADDRVLTVLLTVGDGVTLNVRR